MLGDERDHGQRQPEDEHAVGAAEVFVLLALEHLPVLVHVVEHRPEHALVRPQPLENAFGPFVLVELGEVAEEQLVGLANEALLGRADRGQPKIITALI